MSPENEYLSADELTRLTGVARATAQATWLRDQGIAHRVIGRRVIVSRVHVRGWLDGTAMPVSTGDFNWASVR